ncbi:phage gp6-like head-tail connector protein [Paenibacillus tyrfis]|uniref:phage gp6-like head-tail connector protein n=1 Tax=Paenibacillus tyrfis TaxID=1501230 RepID=UPI000B59713C|nr:phage gp6-like head-tail connector protein [Paenibacillus tyrfis]
MLTTLERFKELLQGEYGPDAELKIYLLAASQAIESFCKRSFRKQQYTERLSGYKSDYINLRNFPVASVESLTGPTGEITDYEILSEGRLYRSSGWPIGKHNIQVAYTGGYVLPGDTTPDNPRTLPESIELACLFLAKTTLSGQLGIAAERFGDYSVTYNVKTDGSGFELPGAVISLISPYIGRWV